LAAGEIEARNVHGRCLLPARGADISGAKTVV